MLLPLSGLLEEVLELAVSKQQVLDITSKVPTFAGYVDGRFSSVERQLSKLKKLLELKKLLPVFEARVNERLSRIDEQLSGL